MLLVVLVCFVCFDVCRRQILTHKDCHRAERVKSIEPGHSITVSDALTNIFVFLTSSLVIIIKCNNKIAKYT